MRSHNPAASGFLRKLQLEACKRSGVPYARVSEFEAIGTSTEDLVTDFIKRLGSNYSNLSEIPVGTLPTWDFNASIRAPGGFQIIVLNWGLIQSLTHLTFATIQAVRSKSLTLIAETAVTCAIGIRYGANALRWPALPDVPSELKSFADLQVTSEVLFVLCHEFGHSLLGHLDNPSIVRCSLAEKNPTIIEYYSHQQNKEFDADRKAIDLLQQGWGMAKDIAYGAVYRLFRLLRLYELMFPYRNAPVSHPPALERWKRIEDHWQLGISEIERQIGESDQQATKIFFDRLDAMVLEAQKTDPRLLRAVERE